MLLEVAKETVVRIHNLVTPRVVRPGLNTAAHGRETRGVFAADAWRRVRAAERSYRQTVQDLGYGEADTRAWVPAVHASIAGGCGGTRLGETKSLLKIAVINSDMHRVNKQKLLRSMPARRQQTSTRQDSEWAFHGYLPPARATPA